MEMLCRNSSDKEHNSRSRPLVTVCDTAIFDQNIPDNELKSDSNDAVENVTVTIKMSSASDGVVMEIETRKHEHFGTTNRNLCNIRTQEQFDFGAPDPLDIRKNGPSDTTAHDSCDTRTNASCDTRTHALCDNTIKGETVTQHKSNMIEGAINKNNIDIRDVSLNDHEMNCCLNEFENMPQQQYPNPCLANYEELENTEFGTTKIPGIDDHVTDIEMQSNSMKEQGNLYKELNRFVEPSLALRGMNNYTRVANQVDPFKANANNDDADDKNAFITDSDDGLEEEDQYSERDNGTDGDDRVDDENGDKNNNNVDEDKCNCGISVYEIENHDSNETNDNNKAHNRFEENQNDVHNRSEVKGHLNSNGNGNVKANNIDKGPDTWRHEDNDLSNEENAIHRPNDEIVIDLTYRLSLMADKDKCLNIVEHHETLNNEEHLTSVTGVAMIFNKPDKCNQAESCNTTVESSTDNLITVVQQPQHVLYSSDKSLITFDSNSGIAKMGVSELNIKTSKNEGVANSSLLDCGSINDESVYKQTPNLVELAKENVEKCIVTLDDKNETLNNNSFPNSNSEISECINDNSVTNELPPYDERLNLKNISGKINSCQLINSNDVELSEPENVKKFKAHNYKGGQSGDCKQHLLDFESLVSDSSSGSCQDEENESDFESALEDDFWNIKIDLETKSTFDDDFSSTDTLSPVDEIVNNMQTLNYPSKLNVQLPTSSTRSALILQTPASCNCTNNEENLVTELNNLPTNVMVDSEQTYLLNSIGKTAPTFDHTQSDTNSDDYESANDDTNDILECNKCPTFKNANNTEDSPTCLSKHILEEIKNTEYVQAGNQKAHVDENDSEYAATCTTRQLFEGTMSFNKYLPKYLRSSENAELNQKPVINAEHAVVSNGSMGQGNKSPNTNDKASGRDCCNCSIAQVQNSSFRSLVYCIPYFIENDITESKLRNKRTLERICCLRKSHLEKQSSNEMRVSLEKQDIKYQKDEEFIVEKENLCKTYNENEIENEKCDLFKPGSIVKIGLGYYFVGTGENVVTLIRQAPKSKNSDNSFHVPKRPFAYFRGLPGIINNAYKMSNTFTFPKLSIPKEFSSTKILHACNRLATQLSPVGTRPKTDLKNATINNMTVEESMDHDNMLSPELPDLLKSARDLLNSSRFDEAEATFLKLYKEIQEKPEDNGRLLVETLTGLADICIRRSRMCRSNPLEWQWLCMHSIALLQYTVEFCESELENQLDNEANEWYQEQKHASELKCRPLEDAFTRALYNILNQDASCFDPFQSFSLPTAPMLQGKKASLFPLSSTMPKYLLMPGMSYKVTEQGLQKQCSDDTDITVDWLEKFKFYCKDRLQTRDSKAVTEKILKSTLTTDNDDTESLMSHGSHGSLDWDDSDLKGIEETSIDLNESELPEDDFSFEYELANSDTDNEGWDFFLHQRRNCDFQSVVQVVSNGEKCHKVDRVNQNDSKESQDTLTQEKVEKARKKSVETRDIVSPLHAHSISLTLARSFCRLADKLVLEEKYKKAETVYEKILDIIDVIQDGTAGMLRFSARIMKNLGTVKSKQGKSSSGLVLLNKALNTYRDLQDAEANFEIAIALIELGNGYIVGKNNEDSVFDDVIVAICDFFEKDANESNSTSNSSSVQSHISQMTSSLTSNSEERNVVEAMTCYTEAITLLDCYKADKKQVEMFAKAVMRLGDCHFMQKDYDKALEYYEKALEMFRMNNIYGRDSLMENAHVLCMLGVSSFMLHVYPRAASVFETALHMVRCAYGFTRTFLNGMLQSLAGITYYKMKNYHKCVSMCYQGYETYCEIFGEGMSRLDKQKFWLICQTLYVMGNSYNILNLQQKAVKYLTVARSLMKSSKIRERRQFMRVIQILGDCYFAQYDYKTALSFYNEALEYGECESQVSFDEVFDPNCASDEMTIHNHLVSKSAEAHLSMQQYQNAVHYLEQAHDMQEVMGDDIKGDLINTLNQLGHMHSMAGDVTKAMESYKECLEVFREIHKGHLGPEMCTTLGNLATICYLKACLSEDLAEEQEMNAEANEYFQEALALDENVEVCVKYGTFLYSQCHYERAIAYLEKAVQNEHIATDIVYGGLEKVTLPELLQDEVDIQEEICIPSSCLAKYLLILCHKVISQTDEAETNLISLMEEVRDYDVPLLHSLLGYAMMELMLFEEAAECFITAAETEEDYHLAYENYYICLLILVTRTFSKAINNILEYLHQNK